MRIFWSKPLYLAKVDLTQRQLGGRKTIQLIVN